TMKFDKRIITRKWGNNPTRDEFTSSNGFVISSGKYSRSIAFFLEAAAEAKRDFPFLTDKDIEVFIITKSSYNQGSAGVRFSLPENSEKKGYRLAEQLDFNC